MLYYVSGPVAVLEPGLAVIDCGGVGYGCRVTAYTAAQLKLNQTAKLFITESIREDAFDLYGFISREEQRCYEMLTSVTGVGPKAAMAILSAGPQNFTLAVMTGDEKLLTAAQGVGKKLAQRIILELKDKIGGASTELDFSTGPVVSAPAAQGNNAAMAHAALQELGYSAAEVATALKGVDPKASTEEMIRYALRQMVMKG
jgi:Holliday junction DNA helicase RuvA